MPDVSLPPSILAQSPLSPDRWPFSLRWLPQESYLVGGVVRDVLLGRQADYLDLDFVMPANSVETARAIAKHYNAGFVVLDGERQIARVVFDQATVDFALQEGPTLEQDLRRRDFTVNAMAYNPHTQILVDPLSGYTDLQQHQLRMVSRENLADDPLRLLRAYRQAAQLGFSMEAETAIATAQLAPRLGQVAAERVQSELNTLLSSASGTTWLLRAWEAGLLTTWLPSASAATLAQVKALDTLLEPLNHCWPKLLAEFPTPSKHSLGKFGPLALAKLIVLTDGDAIQAERQLQRLKYSRLEVRAAGTVRRLQPDLAELPLSIRQRFFLFQSVGNLFPLLVLSWLVSQADLVCSPSALEQDAIAPLVYHFLNAQDPVAHPHPLVGGKDLMQALDLKSGPHVGRLLTELQVVQAEGQIHTREEAIAWAKDYLG